MANIAVGRDEHAPQERRSHKRSSSGTVLVTALLTGIGVGGAYSFNSDFKSFVNRAVDSLTNSASRQSSNTEGPAEDRVFVAPSGGRYRLVQLDAQGFSPDDRACADPEVCRRLRRLRNQIGGFPDNAEPVMTESVPQSRYRYNVRESE